MWCELFLTSDIFGWNLSSKNGDIYRSWTTLTNKSHDIYIFGSMLQCPHGNKIPTQKCIPWFCTLSILSVLWTWDSGHVNNKVPFWVSGVLKMYSGSLSLGLRSFRCSKHKWTHHSCASWAFSTQLKSVNLSKSSQQFGPCQLMKAKATCSKQRDKIQNRSMAQTLWPRTSWIQIVILHVICKPCITNLLEQQGHHQGTGSYFCNHNIAASFGTWCQLQLIAMRAIWKYKPVRTFHIVWCLDPTPNKERTS